MITGSIFHQQHEQIVRNNGLRKAAGSPKPPSLTTEETSMIQKKFESAKSITLYNLQGNVNEQSFTGRGRNIDTKV